MPFGERSGNGKNSEDGRTAVARSGPRNEQITDDLGDGQAAARKGDLRGCVASAAVCDDDAGDYTGRCDRRSRRSAGAGARDSDVAACVAGARVGDGDAGHDTVGPDRGRGRRRRCRCHPAR